MDDAVQSLLDCQQNSFMAENEYRAECMKMKKEALELQKEMHEEEMRIRREELIEKRLEREMYNQARMAELQIFQSILSKLPGGNNAWLPKLLNIYWIVNYSFQINTLQ